MSQAVTEEALLELRDISSGYGHVTAVRNINVTVRRGEFVALLGPNGAGKSTLLRTISGLIPLRSGTIQFDGQAVPRSASGISRRGIAHVPEGRQLFSTMTVSENLQMGAYPIRHQPERMKEAEGRVMELFPRLRERLGQTAGTLSGGEGQMLAVGRALMSDPQLLMLDEPSLGLAPSVVEEIFAHLNALNADGLSILLVEQAATLALDHSDRAYLLNRGEVVKSGPSSQLAQDEGVQSIYLGGEPK